MAGTPEGCAETVDGSALAVAAESGPAISPLSPPKPPLGRTPMKVVVCLVTAMAALIPATALAQAATAQGQAPFGVSGIRVATFSPQRAFSESAEGKAGIARLSGSTGCASRPDISGSPIYPQRSGSISARRTSRTAVRSWSSRNLQGRFGGDPNVVGRAIRLSGEPFMVVGVAPAAFALTDYSGWQFRSCGINGLELMRLTFIS